MIKHAKNIMSVCVCISVRVLAFVFIYKTARLFMRKNVVWTLLLDKVREKERESEKQKTGFIIALWCSTNGNPQAQMEFSRESCCRCCCCRPKAIWHFQFTISYNYFKLHKQTCVFESTRALPPMMLVLCGIKPKYFNIQKPHFLN